MKMRRAWVMAAVVGLLMAGQGYAQTNSSGELVQNGDFEAAPTNGAAAIPGWMLVREGDAQGALALDDAAPLGPAGPHALRLDTAILGTRCGAANTGVGAQGIDVKNGTWYDVTFFCRTENKAHTGLVFSLESQDGRTICARATIPEVGGDWQPFTLSLHAYAGDRHARLVISPIDPGVLWLDGVSIRPRASR